MRSRVLRAGLTLLLLSPFSLSFGQDGKLALPSDAELKQAEEAVRGVYSSEYKDKSRPARKALAQKLLAQAPGTKNPAERFLLYREARDLGAEALDFQTAFAAADKLGSTYTGTSPLTGASFNVVGNKLEALGVARKARLSPDEAGGVAEQFLAVALEALEASDYASATKAAQGAEQMGKSSGDASISKKAAELSKDIPLLKAEDEASSKSAKALGESDLPEDNTIHGKFLLFQKGDPAGLKLLAKGSDAALKDAAAKELAKQDAEAVLAVAEAWWSAGSSQRSPLDKKRCQGRAVSLLEETLPSVTGLSRSKVEKRLDEWDQVVTGVPWTDLLSLMTPKDSVHGNWISSPAGLTSPAWVDLAPHRAQVPYLPGEQSDYDLRISFELRADKGWLGVGFISPIGTQVIVQFKGTGKDVPVTAQIQVRRSGYSVKKAGKVITEWKGDWKTLPAVGPMWKMPNDKTLFLQSGATFQISKFQLRLLSGQGKRLRG
jgi:hypothetical protein